MTPNNAIQTSNLTRHFQTIRAVDHLSFEVPSGIVFGFLGPNGSGKTTTIRLLLGLLEPSRGRSEVLGYDTSTQSDQIRQKCGAILEHHGLYERLSAEDNLEFYGRVWHISASDRQSRIKELLTHLDLWDRRKEITGTWSRGMKQKLAFARTLLHRPSLVFLDEPTAGLDPVAAAALREDLAGMAGREGLTVFLTTHNLAEAEKLCQHVAVIRQGKLLAIGSPETLRTQGSKPRLEIRGRSFSQALLTELRARTETASLIQSDHQLTIELKEVTDVYPLVNLVVQSGAQVEEVIKSKASLEDVFLTLMEEDK
jgi:ABC-2 type transport system ATP-binding protein